MFRKVGVLLNFLMSDVWLLLRMSFHTGITFVKFQTSTDIGFNRSMDVRLKEHEILFGLKILFFEIRSWNCFIDFLGPKCGV